MPADIFPMNQLRQSLALAVSEKSRQWRSARIYDAYQRHQQLLPSVSAYVGIDIPVELLRGALDPAVEDSVTPEQWLRQACESLGVPYRSLADVRSAEAVHVAMPQSERTTSATPAPAPVLLADVVTAFGRAINASLADLVNRGVRLLAVTPTLATASDGKSPVPEPPSVTIPVRFRNRTILVPVNYLGQYGVTEFNLQEVREVLKPEAWLEVPLVDADTVPPKPLRDEANKVRTAKLEVVNGYGNVDDLPGGKRGVDLIRYLAAGLKQLQEEGLMIELVEPPEKS